jgi:NADPH:quinone reductase-like Zn-dependent oxidoreductase
MNKIVVNRPGGFGQLAMEAHESLTRPAGHVRVEVRAVGVNFADCIVRMGLYKSAREYVGWPITPGFEFAGTVSELGAGVSDLELGESVFGVVRFGAYASEVVAAREFVRRIPKGLGFTQAGSLSVVFLTAWYALFELAHVRPGERVLVHSAAGGVGSALCQLARAAGADVVAVVGSPHKVEAARQAGAGHVIDKSNTSLRRALDSVAPRGFDVVLDANGAATLKQSYRVLASRGRLVIYGFHTLLSHGGVPNPLRLLVQWLRTPRFDPLAMVDRNVSVQAFNLSYLFEHSELFGAAMDDLERRLASGEIRPLAVKEYGLAEAGEAHRALQSGATIGKLVLLPERPAP